MDVPVSLGFVHPSYLRSQNELGILHQNVQIPVLQEVVLADIKLNPLPEFLPLHLQLPNIKSFLLEHHQNSMRSLVFLYLIRKHLSSTDHPKRLGQNKVLYGMAV